MRRWAISLGVALLMVLAVQSLGATQSTANLQSDIYQLRQEVSQLKAQIADLRGQRGGGTSAPAAPSVQRAGAATLSDRQLIDRLATLAIEAKDRLNALEQRVTRLEARSKP